MLLGGRVPSTSDLYSLEKAFDYDQRCVDFLGASPYV